MKNKWLCKLNLCQQCAALILAVAVSAWANPSCAAEKQKGQKKIYVSTIGLPFYPKENGEAKADFLLYRIDSPEMSSRLLRRLVQLIENSPRNQKQFDFLQRVLSVRNYSKERVYIVVSPAAKGMKIEQPYRFAKKSELFFGAVIETKKDQEFLYLRVYDVDRKNDSLKKVLIYSGKQQELIWQEP